MLVLQSTTDRLTRLHALHRAGIPLRARRRPPVSIDDDWLRREYVDGRRTVEGIADELGASRSTIVRALRRLGVEVERRKPALDSIDPVWLREQYEEHQLSTKAVAALAGVSARTIMSALKYHGIRTRERTEVHRADPAVSGREARAANARRRSARKRGAYVREDPTPDSLAHENGGWDHAECAYCGAPLTPETAEPDHVHPLGLESRGPASGRGASQLTGSAAAWYGSDCRRGARV
jgi:hypothetical protein